jgi:hypothetical protein
MKRQQLRLEVVEGVRLTRSMVLVDLHMHQTSAHAAVVTVVL